MSQVPDRSDSNTIRERSGTSDSKLSTAADPAHPEVYRNEIHDYLQDGQTLSFAHGFNVLYGGIAPPEFVDVVLEFAGAYI